MNYWKVPFSIRLKFNKITAMKLKIFLWKTTNKSNALIRNNWRSFNQTVSALFNKIVARNRIFRSLIPVSSSDKNYEDLCKKLQEKQK